MKTIKSFLVNHDILMPGVYVSRIDGDVTTYDLRFKRPNAEPVLQNDSIHTIEHLIATYVRNGKYADSIIYFGPMGCRTGFYLLTRGLDNGTVLDIVKDAVKFTAEYDGEIPGSTSRECGNCKDHNLQKAKADAEAYYKIIENLIENDMTYAE
jgi:S-ribosylhomocysteine lyase